MYRETYVYAKSPHEFERKLDVRVRGTITLLGIMHEDWEKLISRYSM